MHAKFALKYRAGHPKAIAERAGIYRDLGWVYTGDLGLNRTAGDGASDTARGGKAPPQR